ncbi:hypothetical protein VJJ03_02270 [Capnocytophaga sp. G2]|nr:hypothetical protein [Capnocytophaga sp. G2]MEB3004222.1 hypothetical protein [Capnocytophaga sp. G2]
MLKVAFPVGEFFHNHHSDSELCTHLHGKKCNHNMHFSAVEKHHDCILFQLHQSFVLPLFVYHLLSTNDIVAFFFNEKSTELPSMETFSRGPPPLFSLFFV